MASIEDTADRDVENVRQANRPNTPHDTDHDNQTGIIRTIEIIPSIELTENELAHVVMGQTGKPSTAQTQSLSTFTPSASPSLEEPQPKKTKNPSAPLKSPSKKKVLGVEYRRLGEVEFVHLPVDSFTSVGLFIPQCFAIKVLNLQGNNISGGLDALSVCVNLIALDLSGNQLTTIPGVEMWSLLKSLRVVYLHNTALCLPASPSAESNAVEALASCPKLNILTLHGSPLSAFPAYRHYVVNMIWSLVVLDRHIVSDGEIIAGASFTGSYAPCSKNYKLKSYITYPEKVSSSMVLLKIYVLVFNAFRRQAKYSPVQTIQRGCRRMMMDRSSNNVRHRESISNLTNFQANQDLVVDRKRLITSILSAYVTNGATPSSAYGHWVRKQISESQPVPRVLLNLAYRDQSVVALPALKVDQHTTTTRATSVMSAKLTATLNRIRLEPEDVDLAASMNRNDEDVDELKVEDLILHKISSVAALNGVPSNETNGNVLKLVVPRNEAAETKTETETETKTETPSKNVSSSQRPKLGKKTAGAKPMVSSCRFLKPLLKAEQNLSTSRRQAQANIMTRRKVVEIRQQQIISGQAVVEFKNATAAQANDRHVDHVDIVNTSLTKRDGEAVLLRKTQKEKNESEVYRKIQLQNQNAAAHTLITTKLAADRTELHSAIEATRKEDLMKSKQTVAEQRRDYEITKAGVYRALEDLRQQRSADRTARRQMVREKTRVAHELHHTTVKNKVSALRAQTLSSPAKVNHAIKQRLIKGAQLRARHSFHGHVGIPANINLTEAPMALSTFDSPGPNAFIDPEPLSARAYPKRFWSALPRDLTHRALVEEFEERWREIGNFCTLQECKLRPMEACDPCYKRFREFATTEILANAKNTIPA